MTVWSLFFKKKISSTSSLPFLHLIFSFINKMNQEIKAITESFKPISLEEMDGVALMNRSDTKFILPKSQISTILQAVISDYTILEVNQNRVMTYNSLYYDTPDILFYKWHHNGKNNRLKIRIRNYVESKIHFLEVKRKNGKGITKKSRIAVDTFQNNLNTECQKFIEETTNQVLSLKPVLENKFNRITLVSMAHKERVTIDFNLSFEGNTNSKSFDNLVIIELKQEGVNRNSPIYKSLKKHHILPYSISKYCLGLISLYKDIKYNAFKPQLLKIAKLTA